MQFHLLIFFIFYMLMGMMQKIPNVVKATNQPGLAEQLEVIQAQL